MIELSRCLSSQLYLIIGRFGLQRFSLFGNFSQLVDKDNEDEQNCDEADCYGHVESVQ